MPRSPPSRPRPPKPEPVCVSCLPPRLLDGDAPERTRIVRIGQRRRVQERRIVPDYHVTGAVRQAVTVFLERRMALELVEERSRRALGHALDAERAAGDRVERRAARHRMAPRNRMPDPAQLALLLLGQRRGRGARAFLEIVAVAVVMQPDEPFEALLRRA